MEVLGGGVVEVLEGGKGYGGGEAAFVVAWRLLILEGHEIWAGTGLVVGCSFSLMSQLEQMMRVCFVQDLDW